MYAVRYASMALAMLALDVQAQTDCEKAAYPEYTAAMAGQGLTWEPVKVHTDDGYTLTAFHITGDVETGPFEITRPAVIMQHGMGGSGDKYIGPASYTIHQDDIPQAMVT